jgi:NAD(P)-dependent dehydrogenase (short-subunit alcohol dehydrogenase family)
MPRPGPSSRRAIRASCRSSSTSPTTRPCGAAEQAGDTSIVVNNAGVLIGSRVLDGPVDGIRADLETNLYGTINVARAFAPVLAQRPRSALLNVLSALSWASYGSGYDISKAAAWSATNALRLQLHGQGTVVSGLHVGYMDTEMVADIDAPKSDPREVARQAVDGIAGGEWEILADDVSRHVKSALSEHPAAIYGDRVAA